MLHLPTKRYPISSNAIDYEINEVMAIGHGFEVGVVLWTETPVKIALVRREPSS